MKRIPNISARIATVSGLILLAQTLGDAQAASSGVPVAPSGLTLVASDNRNEPANPFHPVALPGIEAAPGQWTDIKDNTFEQRDHFILGLKRLQTTVDLQVDELNARRNTMVQQEIETRSWDFAMKEMENARSHLRAVGAEADAATSDNWDQMKRTIEIAWQRTQNAYGKVRASTTT